MRDYQKQRKARLPLVRELLVTGFSDSMTARLAGFNVITIRKDRLYLGLPLNKTYLYSSRLYQQVFRRYAQLATARRGEVDADLAKLREILRSWLGIGDLFTVLKNAETVMNVLSMPGCTPEQATYLRLLQTIFKEPGPSKETIPKTPYDFWRVYLGLVVSGEIEAPRSQQALEAEVLGHYLSESRSRIFPVWPKEAVKLVKKILKEALQALTPRAEHLVYQYFGIDCECRTYTQIADSEGVCAERARQIILKACRRLSYSTHVKYLKPLVCSAQELLENEMRRATEAQQSQVVPVVHGTTIEYERVCVPEVRMSELLTRSTDELELSVRSTNCMKNGNIQTIGELIQKSEADLLKVKNFGRKSLKEINVVLAEFGLSLGMRLVSDAQQAT